MSKINSIAAGNGGCIPTPGPTRSRGVKLTASSNDPAQRVKADSDGRRVTISGTASANGFVPSIVTLNIGRHRIHVSPSAGMSPAQTMSAVAAKLPEGFKLVPTKTGKDAVSFIIARTKDQPDQTAGIRKGFTAARGLDTEAGVKVGVQELRAIVKNAGVDGFTKSEKAQLTREWAMLFNGSEYSATAAAQKEFAEIQKRLDAPTVFVK